LTSSPSFLPGSILEPQSAPSRLSATPSSLGRSISGECRMRVLAEGTLTLKSAKGYSALESVQ